MLKCYFLYRLTACAEVDSCAAAEPTTFGQLNKTSTTPQFAARSNYGYVDDDDIVPERHHDWPEAQRARPDFTGTVPGHGFEDTLLPAPSYHDYTAADPYRRAPALSEPLSVISDRLSSGGPNSYDSASIGVYAADVHHSLNDTSV